MFKSSFDVFLLLNLVIEDFIGKLRVDFFYFVLKIKIIDVGLGFNFSKF